MREKEKKKEKELKAETWKARATPDHVLLTLPTPGLSAH